MCVEISFVLDFLRYRISAAIKSSLKEIECALRLMYVHIITLSIVNVGKSGGAMFAPLQNYTIPHYGIYALAEQPFAFEMWREFSRGSLRGSLLLRENWYLSRRGRFEFVMIFFIVVRLWGCLIFRRDLIWIAEYVFFVFVECFKKFVLNKYFSEKSGWFVNFFESRIILVNSLWYFQFEKFLWKCILWIFFLI